MTRDSDGYLSNNWPTLSGPIEGATLRLLSLGAGVQSTTVALMAARGDIGPMPDAAIFADTVWEPRAVMAHLDWLQSVLPFPVHRVSIGSIRDAILTGRNSTGQRFASVPWHIRNPDGSAGLGRRQCTAEWKLAPIKRQVRDMLGLVPRQRVPKGVKVEQWIGISMDEVVRMKPSRDLWCHHRFPLIEAGMDRQACLRYLEERQYPKPPKSACIGCPFHTNAMWRDMRDNAPDDFADAVEVDRQLRTGEFYKMRGREYMHRSLMPLDQAPLNDADPRQLGFDLECEGLCGN